MPLQMLNRKGRETVWRYKMCSVFLMRNSGPLTVPLLWGWGGSLWVPCPIVLVPCIGVQWKPADSSKTNVIPNLESNFCWLSVELLHSAKPLLSEPQNSQYLFKKGLCDVLIIFHDSLALFSTIMKLKTSKISFIINTYYMQHSDKPHKSAIPTE